MIRQIQIDNTMHDVNDMRILPLVTVGALVQNVDVSNSLPAIWKETTFNPEGAILPILFTHTSSEQTWNKPFKIKISDTWNGICVYPTREINNPTNGDVWIYRGEIESNIFKWRLLNTATNPQQFEIFELDEVNTTITNTNRLTNFISSGHFPILYQSSTMAYYYYMVSNVRIRDDITSTTYYFYGLPQRGTNGGQGSILQFTREDLQLTDSTYTITDCSIPVTVTATDDKTFLTGFSQAMGNLSSSQNAANVKYNTSIYSQNGNIYANNIYANNVPVFESFTPTYALTSPTPTNVAMSSSYWYQCGPIVDGQIRISARWPGDASAQTPTIQITGIPFSNNVANDLQVPIGRAKIDVGPKTYWADLIAIASNATSLTLQSSTSITQSSSATYTIDASIHYINPAWSIS